MSGGWSIVRSEQEGTRESRPGQLFTATRVEWLVIDATGTLRETFTLKRDATDYMAKMAGRHESK